MKVLTLLLSLFFEQVEHLRVSVMSESGEAAATAASPTFSWMPYLAAFEPAGSKETAALRGLLRYRAR